jgi:hypothetical protein
MIEDVLERYFTEISTAEVQELPEEMDDRTTVGDAKWMAIRDLAAEVRAERERVTTYIVCNEGNIAEIAVLQARVAELATDAALGRMVREIPRTGAGLNHEEPPCIEWSATFLVGDFYHRVYADTPEVALEAARKEEP